MTLLESKTVELDSVIPDFYNLEEAGGDIYSIQDFDQAKVLVVIFMSNHCPYVQAVLDRINSLARNYRNKYVAVVGINSNDASKYPEDSLENMRKIANREGLEFVYLYDENQSVAREFGAVCTPDIFVYKKDQEDKWRLKYHGAIDDNWKDFMEVETHYLRDAIEELLAANEQVSFEQKPSMGCSIKWK